LIPLNQARRCGTYGNLSVQLLQGHVALEDEPAEEGTFVPVNCPVCAQVHLVDPKTTKVIGAEE
jgi:hypothetical protein